MVRTKNFLKIAKLNKEIIASNYILLQLCGLRWKGKAFTRNERTRQAFHVANHRELTIALLLDHCL